MSRMFVTDEDAIENEAQSQSNDSGVPARHKAAIIVGGIFLLFAGSLAVSGFSATSKKSPVETAVESIVEDTPTARAERLDSAVRNIKYVRTDGNCYAVFQVQSVDPQFVKTDCTPEVLRKLGAKLR